MTKAPLKDQGPALRWQELLETVRACRLCEAHLPLGPRPILQVHPSAKILIAGQAPGRKVHATGIPFNDVSGDRLRRWLGIDRSVFYDERKIALLPMGFCYPGTGNGGDLPPRPECAEAWRRQLLVVLKQVELTILLGRFALDYHLPVPRRGAKRSVSEAVCAWRETWPTLLPMPHPSPRNQNWLKRHPWFEKELVPELQERVAALV